MKINPTIARLILLVAVAIMLFILPGLKLPYLDQKADTYFSEAMTKAGLAYGVCRVINASVSVIKESQVQLEPAGLGVSLAAGQLLDPLDDMTERASDILVTAIVPAVVLLRRRNITLLVTAFYLPLGIWSYLWFLAPGVDWQFIDSTAWGALFFMAVGFATLYVFLRDLRILPRL